MNNCRKLKRPSDSNLSWCAMRPESRPPARLIKTKPQGSPFLCSAPLREPLLPKGYHRQDLAQTPSRRVSGEDLWTGPSKLNYIAYPVLGVDGGFCFVGE